MAARTSTGTYVANSESIPTKLHDAADGPGKAPYVDGREMASFFAADLKVCEYDFIVDTTEDDNGDVIAAADDVTVNVGFTPLVSILSYFDAGTPGNSQFYTKFAGVGGAWAYFTDSGVVNTITDARMTFGSGTVVIGTGATIAAKTYKLIVLGK